MVDLAYFRDITVLEVFLSHGKPRKDKYFIRAIIPTQPNGFPNISH